MIIPAFPVVFALAIVLLVCHLRRRPDRGSLWRSTLWIGVGVGIARAGLASLGWYVLQHTGGPLQIPAYALAMMAWPEAAFLDERRVAPVGPEFYMSLMLVLVATTLALVALVALIVDMGRLRVGQDGVGRGNSAVSPVGGHKKRGS